MKVKAMSFRSTSSARSEGRSKMKNFVSKWYSGLLKRPNDRSAEQVLLAHSHLKDLNIFDKFHTSLLQQICCYAHYDKLDENTIVIRQGEHGANWYIVLSGSLTVFISENNKAKPLCTLVPGSSF
ncbi:unnamed protein product, partial [Lymnaea stagnalis]